MGKNMNRKYGVVHGVKLIDDMDMVLKSVRDERKAFELESIEYWKKNITQRIGIAVDIGSYSGLYAIIASNLSCYCMAFEPNITMYERIKENILLNKSKFIHLRNEAVSKDLNAKPFYMSFERTSAGSINNSKNKAIRISVQCITLDSLVSKDSEISCIKIDVEGHELDVLEGAKKTLIRTKAPLIIEALTLKQRDAIKEKLISYGYKNFLYVDGRNLLVY